MTPSNKIEDKSISHTIKETPKPMIKTEIDSKPIIIEDLTWLNPWSTNLWWRCLLSGRNGEVPDLARRMYTRKVSVKG